MRRLRVFLVSVMRAPSSLLSSRSSLFFSGGVASSSSSLFNTLISLALRSSISASRALILASSDDMVVLCWCILVRMPWLFVLLRSNKSCFFEHVLFQNDVLFSYHHIFESFSRLTFFFFQEVRLVR
jgi:hypothetical protein